ncbi:MAG: 3-isopropylmalate dehydratase [Candidatus Tectomicrobia bacterium]|uniref:3-isopropylmalate dehydratase small subunit n=1 Tax=Tectimicrobiota bacterium TaxID=2528274 RepID=A0A932GQ55_UNCTE|nr:3-isopropylmalate dehydratase [Candidatus Tectomicrobia bacterium]
MGLLAIRSVVRAKYGDNVTTDSITSSKYVTSTKPEELAKIALRDYDPAFLQKLSGGGCIVAGKNFGGGSAREWAPVALKAANVNVILAEFFARIFYRNAINVGLPLIECRGISAGVNEGDELEIDLVNGKIENLNSGKAHQGIPIPEFLLDIISSDGLIPYLKNISKPPPDTGP